MYSMDHAILSSTRTSFFKYLHKQLFFHHFTATIFHVQRREASVCTKKVYISISGNNAIVDCTRAIAVLKKNLLLFAPFVFLFWHFSATTLVTELQPETIAWSKLYKHSLAFKIRIFFLPVYYPHHGYYQIMRWNVIEQLRYYKIGFLVTWTDWKISQMKYIGLMES